jgi:hypothetical protein
MKRGVHWLFFNFLDAGGPLISCSFMSQINMSSGYVQKERKKKEWSYNIN